MTANQVIYGEDRHDYLCWRQGSGRTVEIYDISVRNERRKQGIGRRLVNTLLDEHLPPDTVLVWAITRADNIVAKQFYEAMGFRVVANLWNFYQDLAPGNRVDGVMYGRDMQREIQRRQERELREKEEGK